MIYPIVLGSCVGNECRPVKSDESAAASRIRAQVRSEMSAALSRPAFAVAAPSRGEEEEGGDEGGGQSVSPNSCRELKKFLIQKTNSSIILITTVHLTTTNNIIRNISIM